MKVWIIGSGAAGRAAAEEIAASNPENEIGLISQEAQPFYKRPHILDLIAGKVQESELLEKTDTPIHQVEMQLIAGKRAMSIHPREHRVDLSDRSTIHYDKLLIATGTRPTLHPFESTMDGLFTLNQLSDVRRVHRILKYSREVTVYGQGFLAVEMARAFCQKGLNTRLIASEQGLFSDPVTDDYLAKLQSVIEQSGTELILDDPVVELAEDSATRYYAITESGRHLFTELFILELHRKVERNHLYGLPFEWDEGIVVDPSMFTGIPDIYAAGDCAVVRAEGTASLHRGHGWKTATRQGCVAARNMLEPGSDTYVPDQKYEWEDLEGKNLLEGWPAHPKGRNERKYG